ncbi:hypothetical protein PHJA_002840500 [Phtheirospermum japonicum]|uniref:BAH domain-containing protein n=1 Tax=Phtheirospermum japonicum TaxID=374723 RepID=A0A830DGH9_9LAMI|nr:hypothetical protein PHJA_002840500 [Phtheirospermum japonicum]
MEVMDNNKPTASYVDWEEVVVSSEKGRREVHYYLKRGGGGGRDLAVVGKEKSTIHMSYRYTIQNNKNLPSILNRSSRLKLRSRREVIDWLNSTLSGEQPNNSLRRCGEGINNKLDDDIVKDVMLRKVGQHGTEFTWLGSSWTCRKRRTHYQSFCRNGAVISAQDFVYVLAEENKRLVAYLDDMYEDTRGNKMVVVRWFHKIDEVGFVLSPNYNDREIFFSLCLQDLSIECIDGLATVLSPEHYDKFTDDAARMGLLPFVCYRQFDNDEVKSFDVTRIKGYWKQEILKNINKNKTSSLVDAHEFRPSKRVRWSKSPDNRETIEEASLQVSGGTCVDFKGDVKMGRLRESNGTPAKIEQFLTLGSEVEVLSQDSGIRGCWFRASIIKKHKDKVKLQYKDVKDAIDESKNLEEWILASRLASPDALGIRLSGRTIVRPTPLSDEGRFSGVVNAGSIVDAWWHDGWWEGVVVKKESEDCLFVYFPAEKQEVKFSLCDLRHSMEWLENGWQNLKERPDLASKLSSTNKISEIGPSNNALSDNRAKRAAPSHNNTAPPRIVIKIGGDSIPAKDDKVANETRHVRDLSKDNLLARLRWKSSGKRRRSRSPVKKALSGNSNNNSAVEFQTWEKFFVSSSLKYDSDNCKYGSDAHCGSSVVSSLTNLVMSR